MGKARIKFEGEEFTEAQLIKKFHNEQTRYLRDYASVREGMEVCHGRWEHNREVLEQRPQSDGGIPRSRQSTRCRAYNP